jgi:LuxR family quorum sensing-dependent transcriptional regulator
MAETAQGFGRQAFDFIETLDRLDSPAAVVEAMYRAVAQLGFQGVFFAELDPRPPKRFEDFVLASRCPRNSARSTPRGTMPVSIRIFGARAVRARRLNGARPVMAIKTKIPKPSSFSASLPISDFRSALSCRSTVQVAGVALAGSKLDLGVKTKPMIHLMAIYAFATVMDLVAARPHAQLPLTSREREVLAWSAQGKSAWEIGEILCLTQRTINEHAQTAMRKLGATNRTQAVALAIRQRLFDL